ncbi:unnamed protein product [Linum trigynum]|uniref:Uncharacterized protein n=1 Tax=Linum trigynum TaxID=586398 RepID=A0AAV2DN36_9ROSI
MRADEWVAAAMTDDTVVVELLVRLKQAQAAVPAKQQLMQTYYSSFGGGGAVIPVRWGLRLPRSKSAAATSAGSMRCGGVVSRRKEGDSSTRCSPTTPLSWSGGGGAASPSAAGDGYKETSSHRSPSGSRSKGSVATAAEITSTGTTTAKRTRRKKTLAELREEEYFLWKQRTHLKKEIESLHATFKDERTINEKLKRIKIDLDSNYSVPSNDIASFEEGEKITEEQPTTQPSSNKVLLHQSESCSRTDETSCSGDASFLLPDLNMMPSEEDPPSTH